MSHKNKSQKSPPQPDVPFAIAMLEIAVQNLKASRCLYENGFYSEAVFFFQQGIEKGCKSFGFYYGKIRRSDVYNQDFRHKGTAVYDLTLKQLQILVSDTRKKIIFVKNCQENLGQTNDFITDVENEIVQSQRKLQFFSNNVDKYLSISEEDLKCQIAKLNDIDKTLSNFDNSLKETLESYTITDTIRNTSIKILEESLDPNFRATSERYQQLIKNLDHETILTIIHFNTQGLGALGPLLILAIITFPHESRSRYPDQGLPKEFYNSELPIICHFPEVCGIGDKTLEKLQKMYEYLPQPGGVSL